MVEIHIKHYQITIGNVWLDWVFNQSTCCLLQSVCKSVQLTALNVQKNSYSNQWILPGSGISLSDDEIIAGYSDIFQYQIQSYSS